MSRFIHRLLLCALVLLLAACASVRYRPVPGITRVDARSGYRLARAYVTPRAGNRADTFMVVMVSGGGSRAAALGYGVLKAMRADQVSDSTGAPRALTSQIDLIYGVSGGSVLAAYYGLRGDGMFPEFEQRFLKPNDSLLRLFGLRTPDYIRLASPEFGRGDLLAQGFDRALFHGATYSDLGTRGQGPLAVLHATDMSTGTRLIFLQDMFDVLCLDLGRVSVARAVAASSAVPVIFSPVTLNNNGGRCGFHLPEVPPGHEASDARTRFELLQELDLYQAPGRRPYLHLLDGGMTDNLGLRTVTDMMRLQADGTLAEPAVAPRNMVFISVNAAAAYDTSIDQSARVPGLMRSLQAVIDLPVDSTSQQSLNQFRLLLERWREDDHAGTRFFFVNLAMRDLPEGEMKTIALNTPTRFRLEPFEADALVRAGAELLNHNPEYRALKNALASGPEAPNPPGTVPSPAH